MGGEISREVFWYLRVLGRFETVTDCEVEEKLMRG